MKSLKHYIVESNGDAFKDLVNVSFKQITEWRKKTDTKEIMVHYDEKEQCYFVYKINDKDSMNSLNHIGTYNAKTGVLYFDKNESKIFGDLI